MIGFRQHGSKSWLAAQYGPVKSAVLGARLSARCEGCDGLFLTLTYDRSGEFYGERPYDDPLDLYRRAKEEKHVAMFFRKLERLTGIDVSGKWICKLEFQEGGWLHWHIIIVGVTFIGWEDLQNAWGRGHVRFDALEPHRIGYFCKYISKDGSIPSFLLFERQRSVRIVRCSPGFWGNEPGEGCQSDNASLVDGDGLEVEDPSASSRGPIDPWYVPVGEVLEQCENQAICKNLDNDEFQHVKAPAADVLKALTDSGGQVKGFDGGWLLIDGIDWETFQVVTADLVASSAPLGGSAAGSLRAHSRVAAESPRGGREASAPLYLNTIPNRDIYEADTGQRIWLDRYFEFCFGWREEF